MKIKYFFFGFLSAILILIIAGYAGFRYIKWDAENNLIEKLEKSEVINFELISFEDKTEFKKLLDNSSEINKANKKYFVNFWATWCVPCIAEMPHILSLEEEFEDVNFIFATNDKDKNIESFLKNRPQYKTINIVKYNVDSSNIFFQYQAIPTTYIFNSEKEYAIKITGSQNFSSKMFKDFLSTF